MHALFFFFSFLICLLLFPFYIFSYTLSRWNYVSPVLSLLCFIFSLLFINKFCWQSLKYCSCEWSACINVNIVWMHYSTFAFVTIYEYMFLMWISLITLDQSMHDIGFSTQKKKKKNQCMIFHQMWISVLFFFFALSFSSSGFSYVLLHKIIPMAFVLIMLRNC